MSTQEIGTWGQGFRPAAGLPASVVRNEQAPNLAKRPLVSASRRRAEARRKGRSHAPQGVLKVSVVSVGEIGK
jgi:hypothetical protein